jgi:hypothetical protein
MLFKLNKVIELPDGDIVAEDGSVGGGNVEMSSPYARLTSFKFDILTEKATIDVSYYSDWNEQTKPTHQRQFTFDFPLTSNNPQMAQLTAMIDGALQQRFNWIKIHEGAERIVIQ